MACRQKHYHVPILTQGVANVIAGGHVKAESVVMLTPQEACVDWNRVVSVFLPRGSPVGYCFYWLRRGLKRSH
jgi:hypothetical protein